MQGILIINSTDRSLNLTMKENTVPYDLKSRRRFLQNLSCLTTAIAFPGITKAAASPSHMVRQLAFDNLHTGEKLSLTYFERGRYLDDALLEINKLLRDHRSGDIYPMDTSLIDLLFDLKNTLGTHKPFQVISGYRSPATNSQLQKSSSGVATKSLHMLGKAIDIRIDGLSSKIIQNTAINMARGGVGYYQQSDFVHIDTGKARFW